MSHHSVELDQDVGAAAHEPSQAIPIAGRPGWVPAVAGYLVPIAIWAGLALFYYSSFVRHPSHGIVGGPDGVLFGWFFQSVEHSLATGHNPFISGAMNAPTGLNLMWNTSLVLLAILLAPLTAVVGGLAVAGWLMVLAPVLSATSAFLVLRRLTGLVVGSALTATLYGFGPFFVGQAGHLHLTFGAIALPVLLLLGYRLLFEQTGSPVRIGIRLGLVVTATMLIAEEVVATVLVMALVAVVAGLITYRDHLRDRVRFAVVGLAVGAAVSLVLLAIPLYYQFLGPLALRGVEQGNQPLDLAGLIRPSNLQYYARASDIQANNGFLANGAENTGYLGLPLIALVIGLIVWLARRRDRFALCWSLTAASVIVLSFGTRLWVNGHLTKIPLPWYVFKQLPLLHSAVTVRFSVVTTLLIALLITYSLARLPRGRPYAIGLLVVAVCFIPLRPTQSASSTYDEIDHIATPRFFTTSAVNWIAPGSTALLLPQADGPFAAQLPMYWQIRAGMRFNIVGGYAVFKENGKSTYVAKLPAIAVTLMQTSTTGAMPSDVDIAAAKASLPASTIRYVVITNQLTHPDLVAQAAASITGCTPERVADVYLCEVPRS